MLRLEASLQDPPRQVSKQLRSLILIGAVRIFCLPTCPLSNAANVAQSHAALTDSVVNGGLTHFSVACHQDALGCVELRRCGLHALRAQYYCARTAATDTQRSSPDHTVADAQAFFKRQEKTCRFSASGKAKCRTKQYNMESYIRTTRHLLSC